MYCCNTMKYLGRNDQKWGNKREWLIIIQRGKCRNHSRFNYSTHLGILQKSACHSIPVTPFAGDLAVR